MLPTARRLTGLATAEELADLFTAYAPLSLGGARPVKAGTVRRWHATRDRTGMPDAVQERRLRRRGIGQRQWDVTAALSWFLDYQPPRGASPGNGNALVHGRFRSVRATRAASSGQAADTPTHPPCELT